MPYSTDIKDYYRRAWGLGDRPKFKFGGSWADWQANFSDQMTFEEYLQMDLKEKKPHALDEKADGGRIGYNVAGIVAPALSSTALRLLATAGITAAAAQKMATENPTRLNNMLANLFSGPGTLDPSAVKFIPTVHGGKELEKIETKETFPIETWKESYKDAGTKIPEKLPETEGFSTPPIDIKSKGLPIPKQRGWQDYVLYNKEQTEKKKKKLETFIKSQSEKASKVKIHEKAKYLDDDWMNAINEFTLTKHGGNFNKAMSDLGLNVEQVKGIFHRNEKKLVATGHRLESDLLPGTRTFKEVTTEMKYEPEILMNRYKQLVEEGKIDPKKYYNSKQLAHLFDLDTSIVNKNKKSIYTKELVQRFKEEGVKFEPLTKSIKAYEAEDAVNKMLARMKGKKVAGDPKSKSVRSKLEVEFFGEKHTNMLNNIRARTVDLAKEIGVHIKGEDIDYFGAGDDVGHALSLEVMARYPELFKNSDVRSFQTIMYQDPVVNRRIIVGEGFQGRQERIFKKLDQYVDKKISKDNIKEINNLGTDLENIHKKIIESINSKAEDNSYFIGQSARVPELKLKKFKVGDTFKSEDISADMSTVDKKFQLGEISKINPNAKNFKDLSKKEQKLYETNVINQHVENLEKFYKHSFSADEIQELKDALEYGSFESRKGPVYKAEGGLSGVDQYLLNRYK